MACKKLFVPEAYLQSPFQIIETIAHTPPGQHLETWLLGSPLRREQLRLTKASVADQLERQMWNAYSTQIAGRPCFKALGARAYR